MVAIILTKLLVTIDTVEDAGANARFALAFLRFDFCDARIALPVWRARLFASLTLTLPCRVFVPDLRASMARCQT